METRRRLHTKPYSFSKQLRIWEKDLLKLERIAEVWRKCVIDNCNDFRLEFLNPSYSSSIKHDERWVDACWWCVAVSIEVFRQIAMVWMVWRWSGQIYSIVKHPAGCFLSDAWHFTTQKRSRRHRRTSSDWIYLEFNDEMESDSARIVKLIKNIR